MKIEGVPEGYELVRIGKPRPGELYIGGDLQVAACTNATAFECYAIVSRLEPITRPMTRDEFIAAWKERGWCPLLGGSGNVYCVTRVGEDIELNNGHYVTFNEESTGKYNFASDNSPLTITE